ncbi:hypothetical protein A3D78_06270 [Candidatus Gottesmanbacteria bacterium RIFCSPHIGHO2_02_FULL_39_14]|uniref:Peptidase A2 domain-containing protein n=2 Tax=Candidatus Gottesmaniibacteriota TaxID=1752720 RepID=A0A1F5ZY75_9BACT|nr:MAG: hypothetical protein A2153_00960 [Candidatus Gottesmanbacteria bacterium RBG_16_38_7b]OGG17313.1 MAG: hypothetical protein A3D78_06270 [Candidatus Gottesmanbacteria bacterium RIFCSPHIGHO2_02_FULL_39_14]
MPQIVSFPFKFIGQTKLGKIYRPYAIVEIFSKKRNKWQPIEMIIDSGADYTLLPKRYAVILGVDLITDCWVEVTLGVGGSETVYQCKNLLLKINNFKQEVPAGFIERDDLPPLLGRLGCLEDFKLIMKNKISFFGI